MSNAIKFTFEGAISIFIDYDRLARMIHAEVRDSGIGIRQEDQDKLFRFFGQSTSANNINRGGMGLGLTISKMIVHELGGRSGSGQSPERELHSISQ